VLHGKFFRKILGGRGRRLEDPYAEEVYLPLSRPPGATSPLRIIAGNTSAVKIITPGVHPHTSRLHTYIYL